MSRIIHIFLPKDTKKVLYKFAFFLYNISAPKEMPSKGCFSGEGQRGKRHEQTRTRILFPKINSFDAFPRKEVQPQKHCSILQRMRQHPLKGRYITMKVTITGKNIEVSEYLRDLALKKIAKLERYFPEDTEVLITMAVEKNRHIVEVTIPYQGGIIRGEESTGDMYASIDNVIAKLEKQIHRHKTRLEKSLRYDDASPEYDDYDDEDEGPHIVRVKRFSMKPMSVEEAMLQLELLGHSFFVFTNAETDRINVIYARKDGNFGLIEPDR